MSFHIQRAHLGQVDALCAIERAAVELFRGHRAWPSYRNVSVPPEVLREAIARGLVWVAVIGSGEPVGFVWLDAEEGGNAIGVAVVPGVAMVVGGVPLDMRMGIVVGTVSALLVGSKAPCCLQSSITAR